MTRIDYYSDHATYYDRQVTRTNDIEFYRDYVREAAGLVVELGADRRLTGAALGGAGALAPRRRYDRGDGYRPRRSPGPAARARPGAR